MRARLSLPVSLTFAAGCAVAAGALVLSAADAGSGLGEVSDFSLKDYRGAAHALADFGEKKLVVCVFLGTECPLVKLYAPRLVELAQAYEAHDVAFIAVNSNQQDSLTKIAAFARRHGITFPVLKDPGNRLADQLKVTRTPEVLVWDQSHAIRYRGRIDDQYGVGTARGKPTRNDLRDALDALLEGRPVAEPVTQPVGCLIGRVRKSDGESPVTYSRQIARILQQRCVECHREGEIAPFRLTSYDDAVGWAEMIGEVVEEERMPPWHADPRHGKFANDRRLTETEKTQILEWVRRGAPEGDPAELPAPRQFVIGSQLPRPADQELLMRSEPFVVRAEGVVAYQNFEVDPGFTEDKWISMAEALPGNRAVVHHIVVFVKPPENKESSERAPGLQFLTTYVPGYLARPLPARMAKWVPAGSKFVFQMHYTPVGTEQSDLSRLRLVFAEPHEVDHLVLSSAVQIEPGQLQIPANAPNHRSEAAGEIGGQDWRLLSLFPHMHLRGKSFRIDARYPDGTVETLLDVPRYDFNWQTTYELAAPKPIPPGTQMIVVGHHDNSASNPANPDPNQNITWGEQTWEEMLIALFEWTIPVPESLRDAR